MVELGLPIVIGLAAGIITLNILLVLFWCHLSRRRWLLSKEQDRRLRTREKPTQISAAMYGTTSPLRAAAGAKDIKDRWSSPDFPTPPCRAVTAIPRVRQLAPTYGTNKRASDFAVDSIHPLAPSPLSEEVHQSEVLTRPNKIPVFPACPTYQTLTIPTTESSLRRGVSFRSEDTESVYSAASAPPDLHERLCLTSEAPDPMAKTPTSSSKREQSSFQADKMEPFSEESIKDHLIPCKGVSRTMDVKTSPPFSSAAHQLQSHVERISPINELDSRRCTKGHWKVAPQKYFGEPAKTARFSAEAENNSTAVAFNDDQARPILKLPADLARHRKKSISALSLIPQGPLFGTALEILLAAPDSNSKPPSSDRESRTSHCYPAISTAAPIIPPVSSPFPPPIMNEPVHFSAIARRAT